MCGIIGYVGNEEATPIIVAGLKKLEYRGYDSAGVAVFNRNKFDIAKQKGRIANLEASLKNLKLVGNMGLGHTRWATHGEPSDVNSHPHVGENSKIAIVHNGIIENYKPLKERLERKGITFASQTDSEVIAQMAEYYYKGDIIETVIKVAERLEGSYALGVMCLDNPDTLVAIKKDNPLIVGVSKNGNFIASDIPAVLEHTDTVYYMNDMEIAVLASDSVKFYNIDNDEIQKTPETITWSVDSAEKGGEPHFMLKEIKEQPRVLRDTVNSALNDGENKKVIDGIDVSKYNKIVITACGSAYNAGFAAKYILERLCGMSVEVELASEFRYKDAIVDEKTLVILISQSGETADTLAALREAKAKKATTFSIVNVIGSAISKESDLCIFTAAGPEIAVATTKAFSAQLVLLYIIAVKFAVKMGKIDAKQEQEMLDDISAIPEKVEDLLGHIDNIQKYAATCMGYKSIFFIGRNIDYAITLEGSLKLKEISYIHSEAYAGGELKHGPISLITEEALVIAISNCEKLYGKIMSNVEQVISRGAKILLVGNTPYEEGSNEHIEYIKLPECHELFSPSLSVIILQLFSYYIAANKGLDIDKPRNLAKSVTVE